MDACTVPLNYNFILTRVSMSGATKYFVYCRMYLRVCKHTHYKLIASPDSSSLPSNVSDFLVLGSHWFLSVDLALHRVNICASAMCKLLDAIKGHVYI